MFNTDSGTAIPILNELNILGTTVANHNIPLETLGSGNTVTIEAQYGTSNAISDPTKAGFVSLNSTQFSVDANGYVSLIGGGAGIDSIAVQTGTSPVVPTVGGLVTINGAVVAAGTNPVRSDGTGANTLAIEVQISQALASADVTKIGLSNFDSAAFDVTATGFVQLNGGGIATTAFDVQANTAPGTDPVVPTGLGVVTVNGAAVANHSVVLETRSRAANAYNLEIQYAAAAAATDATKSGVAHFNSSNFTVDANGFVTFSGQSLVSGVASCFFPSTLTSFADNLTLTGTPETYPEVINSKACTAATSPVFFERFVSGSLGLSSIPAGVWEFNIWAGASSVANSNIINFRINKRVIQTGMTATWTGAGPTRTFTVTGGTPFVPGDANVSRLLASLVETPTQTGWITAFTSSSVVTITLTDPAFVNVAGVPFNAIYYYLFNADTPELSATAVTLYTVTSTQPAFSVGVTDRIVAAFFGSTDGNRTLELYYGGTQHFSYFCTPIATQLTLTGTTGGALSPTVNNFNLLGGTSAAGTTPVAVAGGGSTLTTNVQISQALASTDATKVGLCNFNSAAFSVDANGFVSLAGGGLAIDSIGVDATSGGGTNPVLPTVGGLVTVNGATVAAGTNPIRSVSTAVNVYQIQAQISQALAAADGTKIGLSNFDSTSFAVAATGFVTLSTTGAGKTITGDSGGALSPVANNWNILGGPGVTTSGSGATLTINSVVFTDTGATTLAVDNGYNATAAGTYNMPATAAQGELIIVFCDTTGAVVLDCPALNFIRIGSLITSSGGTVTSTLQGDSLTLRYRLSSLTWEAVSVIGTWVVA